MNLKKGEILFIAIFIIILGVPVLLKPETYPSDDAFFYLQVAWNIIAGNGSTFHGITETNGYHPLWMIVCTAAAFISGSKIMLLHLTVMIQFLIFTGIVILFLKLCRRLNIDKYLIALPLLGIYFLAIGTVATEAHLNALFLLWTLLYFLEIDDKPVNKSSLIFGLIAGFAVLARLDNIFLVAVILIFSFIRNRNPGQFLISALAAALPVAIYLLWNYLNIGSIFPVSGAIKSTFPNAGFDHTNLGAFGLGMNLAAAATLLYAVLFEKNKMRRQILITLNLGVILHGLYVCSFTFGFTFWRWYYVAGMINFAFVISMVTDKILSFLKKENYRYALYIAAVIVISIIAAGRTWSEYFNPAARGYDPFQFRSKYTCIWNIETAKKLDEMLPSATKIFIHDWPGMIAYFSELSIFPADGLMNDYDYQEKISRNGIMKYLRENNIEYIIAPYIKKPLFLNGIEMEISGEGSIHLDFHSTLTGDDAGRITLDKKDMIVDFREAVPCGRTQPIGLWKLPE